MWGVAKIFTSGHSKGGFDRTPRTPPGYGYAACIQEETVRRLVPSRGSREGSSVGSRECSSEDSAAGSTPAPASDEPNLLGYLSGWGRPG